MIPPEVMTASHEAARARVASERPTSRVGAAVIIAIWLLGLALAIAVVREVWA